MNVCTICKTEPPPFTQAKSAFIYSGQLVTVLHQIKYGGSTYRCRPLSTLLKPHLDQFPTSIDFIVPVPLHPKQIRRRGYNQSALLARELVRTTGVSIVFSALERCRNTIPQVSLDRAQRYKNVQHAFRANPTLVHQKNILVVDDVMTTGATARACSEALLDGGAAKVYFLTLARAVL
jgi:ComF family protein